MFSVTRYHDFSAGHRVVGHESKCKFLHGHNYRVHFVCVSVNQTNPEILGADGRLDEIGRVVDFGVIKSTLCQWLEDNWDHKMLIWKEDDILDYIVEFESRSVESSIAYSESFVEVPFNPTAENMARYLVEVVGPSLLEGSGIVLDMVKVEETRKCSAMYTRVI